MFKYIFPDWFLKKHLETLNVFRLWAFILVNFAFTSLKPKCTIWWLSKFDQNCSHIVSTTKNKRKCFSSSFSRFGHLECEKVNPVWIPPLPPPLLSPRVCLFVLCVFLSSQQKSKPGFLLRLLPRLLSPRVWADLPPHTGAPTHNLKVTVIVQRMQWQSMTINDTQWHSMTITVCFLKSFGSEAEAGLNLFSDSGSITFAVIIITMIIKIIGIIIIITIIVIIKGIEYRLSSVASSPKLSTTLEACVQVTITNLTFNQTSINNNQLTEKICIFMLPNFQILEICSQ